MSSSPSEPSRPPDLPRVSLDPLRARIDRIGIIEHAIGACPAPEFGHCTDDAGRALGLAALLGSDRWSPSISGACLRQLAMSQRPDGRFTLRLDAAGRPTADPPSDDSQARAAWGLAVALTTSTDLAIRHEAGRLLARLNGFSTSHPRAAAHAVLAGLVLVDDHADSIIGHRLIERNAEALPRPDHIVAAGSSWQWPEPRLSYGNGLIVEALLGLAAFRGDDRLLAHSLSLLDWLARTERGSNGWFGFTPVGGRGPETAPGPRFDQQPIEAWTLADACHRAHVLTADARWLEEIRGCVAWFLGENDNGVPVWDSATGAAHDGLTVDGVNANEGTESTMAWIGTLLALRSAERHRMCSHGRSSR